MSQGVAGRRRNGTGGHIVWRAVCIVSMGLTFAMATVPAPMAGFVAGWHDKLLHGVAFLLLTRLSLLAWPQMARFRLFLALAAFGAVIELVQALPALGRDGDVLDWLADILAIATGLAMAGLVRQLRTS